MRSQVKGVIMADSEHDGNILVCAAASGCKSVFEATRVALQQGPLTDEEVRHPSSHHSRLLKYHVVCWLLPRKQVRVRGRCSEGQVEFVASFAARSHG